jgi:hypothetical protein
MYHANAFPLLKSEGLPVHIYSAQIEPKPVNRPQFYQILGVIAKKIMFEQCIPIVSIDGYIESLPSQITGSLLYEVNMPLIGNFKVQLTEENISVIGIDDFENYSHLVCRLADIALTIYSNQYYKFHPNAPYILRDEPYFDTELIGKTGIIDSKSYYRGLLQISDNIVFILNRETQLRSNKNLLVEMKCLAKSFEERNGVEIDFYDPPPEFMSFVNNLLRDKTADIVRSSYPGPSVKRIEGITWKYRAGDKTPSGEGTPIEYLRNTYSVNGLDPRQPLVYYEVQGKTQYHVPEVLSLGHTFEDLAKRIPAWQRSQVWGSIHPDCKNQLHKIYDVLLEIDSTLRATLPEVYPKFVEISKDPMDVSNAVSEPLEIELQFANKSIKIKPPYDTNFYRNYSEKKNAFAKSVENPKILVCVDKINSKVKNFLNALATEYKIRNGSDVVYAYGPFDPAKNQFAEYQMVLTIGSEGADDEQFYSWYKKTLQNDMGIAHQHITMENADENSIMQVVMQMCLKMGGDPWLLPETMNVSCVFGINSYLNPETGRAEISVLVVDGKGQLITQLDPIDESKIDEIVKTIIDLADKYPRVLFLTTYNRSGLTERMKTALENSINEHCIVTVIDNTYFRFFETYSPRQAPRFGKTVMEVAKCSVEAVENAPQGRILRCQEEMYYLLTGKTIEKDLSKRGCPSPIKIEIKSVKGQNWVGIELAKYILSLCMMGRASGHMTRFPMPLYYLQQSEYYYNKFGVPKNAKLKQSIFYV